MDNVQQLKAALAKAIKNYHDAYERWSASDSGAGPPKHTDSDRILAMIAFEEHRLPYVETTNAIFLIKGKYYYVSTTGKWRVKGNKSGTEAKTSISL